MARSKARKVGTAALGKVFGDAVGEGFAAGLAGVMPRLEAELATFVDDIVAQLREDHASALAARAQEPVEEAVTARGCQEEGCGRRAVARGLCRRHYARRIYVERREREGRPVSGAKSAKGAKGGRRERAVPETPAAKKVAVPVAPTVRRKGVVVSKSVSEPTPSAAKAAPAVEDVARFFGLK